MFEEKKAEYGKDEQKYLENSITQRFGQYKKLVFKQLGDKRWLDFKNVQETMHGSCKSEPV